MEKAASETNELQLELVKNLIQDSDYALEIAIFLDNSYYTGQGKTAPPFISREEELDVVSKPASDQQIAMNLAGFYALESGLDYFSTIQGNLPSDIIQSIVDDKLPQANKDIFCRLANAAWKAGQPFRGMERIARPVFVPFDLLSNGDIAKDWTQIKAAAGFLHAHL